MLGAARKVWRILERLEDILLIGLLAAMILLAALQILLRNLFDSGLIWADPLLRIQVLWIGLVGAMVASRNGRHITIDALSRFLPPRLQAVAGAVTDLFTAGVCGILAWQAGRFVRQEMEFAAAGVLGIPAWIFAAVIPAGFALIGLRYLVSIFGRLTDQPEPREAP